MTPSSDILLTTLNAKFIHCAFGLRYLYANLGALQPRATLLEFEIQQRPLDIVEALLVRRPRIVGLGVYIWNVRETTEVVALLKRLAPEVIVILGGPEVSYEWEGQEIVRLADHVITGEADLKFAEVCGARLAEPTTDVPKIIPAELPKLEDVVLPYELYTPDDLAHRVIYVEASRGCPFTCEFCLSSLDLPVRQFPLEKFLTAMDRLLARGATQFKFVDRTFNLNLHVSRAILQFFLARMRPGLFVHYEMVPDRLPEPLREVIAQFPPGALQFEVGIQTFDEATARHISRRQDYAKLAENLTWLRTHTGVHVHADLIVGLPGESQTSFAAGFDRLVALGPQEIQVGILKRLRGTPIVRHDAEFQMCYSPLPPYELLANRDLDFPTMQRLRRFARYWDLVANSGNFRATTPLLWRAESRAGTLDTQPSTLTSPFAAFLAFSDWLFARVGKRHGIALDALAEALFLYLTTVGGLAAPLVATSILADFERAGRRERPACLQPHLPTAPRPATKPARATAPKRQAKHLPTDALTPP